MKSFRWHFNVFRPWLKNKYSRITSWNLSRFSVLDFEVSSFYLFIIMGLFLARNTYRNLIILEQRKLPVLTLINNANACLVYLINFDLKYPITLSYRWGLWWIKFYCTLGFCLTAITDRRGRSLWMCQKKNRG